VGWVQALLDGKLVDEFSLVSSISSDYCRWNSESEQGTRRRRREWNVERRDREQRDQFRNERRFDDRET
jgi:hypothetical protein